MKKSAWKRTWRTAARRMTALTVSAVLAVTLPFGSTVSEAAPVPEVSLAPAAPPVPGTAVASVRPGNAGVRLYEAVDFSQRPYEHFSTDVVDKAMEDFKRACGEQGQEEEVGRLYDLMVSEFDRLATMSYIAQIRYDADVSSQDAAHEQAYTTDLYSEVGNRIFACLKQGLDSPYGPLLEDKIGEAYVPMVIYYEEYSDKDLELYKREQELIREYDQLASGTTTVEYNGEPWNYERLEKEEDISTQIYREVEEALDREKNRVLGGKYQELVRLRAKIAEAAGYDSYAEYAQGAVYGRDYTLEDTRQLCRNVKDYIVPLGDTVWDMQFADVDNASYSSLDQLEGSTTEEILDTVGNGIGQIAPELKDVFRYMRDNHLYDIRAGEDGADRTDGSYTVGLASYRDAFIFINRDQTYRDYQSLIHEFGHFSSYYFNTVPELYLSYNVDLCETQSQGLEILSTGQAETLFGDGADAYVFEVVTDMLYTAISACMIQEFEEAVYADPDMTLDEMNRRFKEIQDSYNGWFYRTYGDTCYEWVDIPHIFHSPVYYIGYGTSSLSSLDLWVLSGQDRDQAARTYLGILHEGTDTSYRSAMDQWGMKDVFDPQDMEELAREFTRLGSPDEENASVSQEETSGGEEPEETEPNIGYRGQERDSVAFVLLAGVGTVIVLQVMILCTGLVILWVLVRKRKDE